MHIKRTLKKIVSGGQTGVDRAALDVALKCKIVCGGWCPNGRIAEDGIIPKRYPLKETESSDYEIRTEWNVKDSDGTLVLNEGELTGGTAFTVECAKKHKKPYLIVDLDNCSANVLDAFWNWIEKNNIKILNMAGPRESKLQGIYKIAKKFLE
ncbi:MAG: putative molybdenum carrier protein [Candidatus Omnitrophota bacterium]